MTKRTRKGKAEAADEEARIRVGDHVDTPGGRAWVVSEELGGFKVNLEADLPEPSPGYIVNKFSGEGAVYVPTNLLRKIEDD